MKIWCFLCFGEEREDYKKRETMSESDRDVFLVDVDCEQGESELGFWNQMYEDYDDGVKYGLQLGEGTSSSSVVPVLDRDSQSKRPKVHQSVAQ